jgi:hypothetical protein
MSLHFRFAVFPSSVPRKTNAYNIGIALRRFDLKRGDELGGLGPGEGQIVGWNYWEEGQNWMGFRDAA